MQDVISRLSRYAHHVAIGFVAILPAAASAYASGPPRPTYSTTVDYPEAALRAREQGTVGYRITVGTNGRVTQCTITASSGSASLDAATCQLMQSRARFTPARDSDGHPVEDSADGHLTWRLPD